MGKESVQGALLLSALSFVVTIISLCLPFYKIVVSTSEFTFACTINLYAAGIHTVFHATNFCESLQAAEIDGTFCAYITGAQTSDVVEGFCLPEAPQELAKGACRGMWFAYTMGMLIAAAVITNTILEGVSVYLLYEYMTTAPNRRKRILATTVQAIKLFVIIVPLLFYGQLTIMQLDDVPTSIDISMKPARFSTRQAGGASKGYGGMWIGFCFQLVAALLTYQSGHGEASRREVARQSGVEMRMFDGQVPPPHFNTLPHPPGGRSSSIRGYASRSSSIQGYLVSGGEIPATQRQERRVSVPFEKQSSFTVGPPEGQGPVPTRPRPSDWGEPWDGPEEAEAAPQAESAPPAGSGT